MSLLARRPFGALTGLLLLAGVSLVAQAPQAPSVFRGAANLVEVIVRVTDENGRFVPNLTIKDFELFDEGRPQTVVAFNRRDLPRAPVPSAAAARPVLAAPEMSTIATNDGVADARLFVLLMDDMRTPSTYILPIRRVAREFVERWVGPSDLTAVFPTSGRGVITQEFTTDKTRVLAAIGRFLGTGQRFNTGNPNMELEQYDDRVVADVTKALALHLDGIRGRRISLIWLSGAGLDPSKPEQGRAIDALRRANVTLYAVDPRRLLDPGAAVTDTLGDGDVAQAVSRWGETAFGDNVGDLRNFAAMTGGFAAVNTNGFADSFDRILDESSQYYVLGFQPANPGHNGDLRDIHVLVPAQPQLRVSARPAYVVGPPRPPTPRPRDVAPALSSALVNNLPTAGLPMRVQAIPRRGTGAMARVQIIVEVAGKDLQFKVVKGLHQERLEFALRTIDFLARSSNNQKTTVTLNLTPEQLDSTRRTGVRWLSEISLRPGKYNLRVAGQAVGTGQSGAVFTDIDVPKFEDERLWVGGLAVTSRPAALMAPAGPAIARLGLPGPPTTARSFVRGDVVTVSAEVQTPASFKQGTLQVTVRPQTAAFGAPALLDQTVPLADRAAAQQSHAWTINTTSLGPGAFVLRVTLRDARGASTETAVLFDVSDR